MSNVIKFQTALTEAYRALFQMPDYTMVAARYTPEALAEKFTAGLLDGSASNDGDGVKRACKACGIKPTYKAIRQYLSEV